MIPAEYLAGFVDGEGYLGLARIPRRNRTPEFCVRLCVYNTHLPVLQKIRKGWGGTMSYVARNVPVWKPSYALIWTNAAAARVVRQIAPFLIVKSRQAETLIRFDERIQTCRRSRDRGGHLLPLGPDEVSVRQFFYERLKELNRRGSIGLRSLVTSGPLPGRSAPSPEYVAGFIDAEGSLMIVRSILVSSPGVYQYHPRISVSNTKKDVLLAIQRVYGGILVNEPARNPAWSNSYQLIWIDRAVERVLSSVKNHLIVRASQAAVLSQLIRLPATMRRFRNGRALPSPSAREVELREALRKQMKNLNRRGLTPGSRLVDT